MHAQTWVKVNAPVDLKIAELVSVLNGVEGLETLQSCQGSDGKRDGYVYFSYGDWHTLCEFVFEKIGPKLIHAADDDTSISVEANSADSPMAKLSFRADAIGVIVSALKEALSSYAP